MTVRSRGRGLVALVGLVVLVGGLVGAAVLMLLSMRRPAAVVDSFARTPAGCTQGLNFSETGRFYVFEEFARMMVIPAGGCVPAATADEFGVTISGPDGEVELVTSHDEIEYELDDYEGESFAYFEITEPGEYEIVAADDDASTVAAIGRDPEADVAGLQRWAAIAAIGGVVVGGLLLVLAGRRSRRAATYASPVGPGWGPPSAPSGPIDTAPRPIQVPINPHLPPAPVVAAMPPPPLPVREAPGEETDRPNPA